MRVQIPAYTAQWMRGDRYGEVLRFDGKVTKDGRATVYSVRLDMSGKVIKVIADDCTHVD